MNVLSLPDQPVLQQIAAVERGLPSSSLTQIVKMIGLTEQRIVAGLGLPQRTVSQRKRHGTRFSLNESERLLRVVRVHRLAREVFSENRAVAEWFNAPDRTLGMKTPLQLLATDLGAEKVMNLVRAMAHGVPL